MFIHILEAAHVFAFKSNLEGANSWDEGSYEPAQKLQS